MTSAIRFLLGFVLAPALYAQNFNIDVGATDTPSAGYGAAANQPGVWNALAFPQGSMLALPLVDLAGAPSSVVLAESGGAPFTCTTGLLGGDDGALLNDHQASGAPDSSTWEISGLAGGVYTFFLYLHTPCDPDHGVSVLWNGSAFFLTVGGPFTGSWVEGESYLAVEWPVTAGDNVHFTVLHGFEFGGLAGLQIRKRPAVFEPFCTNGSLFIDHVIGCPCANAGALGNGCAHSASAAGANLAATGSALADDVLLAASGLPATSYTLFLQHDTVASTGITFHDGVICSQGTLVRLRGRAAVAGVASFPNTSFANDATLTLSQRGQVVPGQGDRRYYSAWYRNASSTFCPTATANVTNGWIVDW